jgi:hypothetical protein
VKFASQSAGFTVNSDTQITATAPAGAAGTVDVTVVTAGGSSATTSADRFSYVPAPTVSGMTPGTDTASGGIPVTITGTHLAAVTAVSFGGTAANFTVNSDTSLTVTTPAAAVGLVSVTVSSPGGTASAGSFIYTQANTVTWVGGSTGDWSVGSNWSGGAPPGSGDDVVIGSGVNVTHSTGTDTIHRLTVSTGLTITGGSLSVNAAGTVTTLSVSGGTLSGSGALTVTNTFNWSGGTLGGGGSLTVGNGISAALSLDNSSVTLGRTLNNNGTMTWSGSNALVFSGGVFNNAGTVSASTSGSTMSVTGTGTFNNSGTFSVGVLDSASFAAGVAFNNTGAVNINQGTLTLNGGTSSGTFSTSNWTTLSLSGYTLTGSSTISGGGSVVFSGGTSTLAGTVSASGGVTVNSGATVNATGTVSGSLTNNGTLSVGGGGPGTLSVGGNFTQSSTATLSLALGGLAAGTQYSRLNVTGTAALAGTVSVSYVNGFVPAAGNTFALLTYASAAGTFGTVSGGSLTPRYDPGEFSLLALAAPLDEGERAAPDEDRLPRRAEPETALVSATPVGPDVELPRQAVVVLEQAPADEAAPRLLRDAAFGAEGGGGDAAFVAAASADFAGWPAWEELLLLPVALLEELLA